MFVLKTIEYQLVIFYTFFCMKYLFFLTLPLLFFACKPDASISAEEQAALQAVKLICEQESDQVHSFVYAILDDSKVKLTEVATCALLAKSDYEAKGIPANALTAVGGQNASHEEYVYTYINEQDPSELRFYMTQVGSEHNHDSRAALASYKNKKFTLLRPLHLADVAGYYWYQSEEKSYVLFLGLKGPNLVSKLFATDEKLPAEKVLQRALPEFASGPETPFNCELNTLVFNSEIGQGKVFWRPDTAAVVFDHFMGGNEEMSFQQISF